MRIAGCQHDRIARGEQDFCRSLAQGTPKTKIPMPKTQGKVRKRAMKVGGCPA